MNEFSLKVFNLTDIFNLSTGASIPKKDFEDGQIPRISATAQDNGIQQFTNNLQENPNFRIKKNFISVSFLGDVFYHPYEASLDMKIHVLEPKNIKLNKHIAIFLVSILKKQFQKYDYGNQLSLSDLKKAKIVLPVNNEETPDYEYMEKYIKSIEEERVLKSKVFIQNKLDKLEYIEIEGIYDKNWLDFNISDIFENLERGKRLTRNSFIDGDTPYVSSTAINNGVDAFIGNTENVRIFSDCLTLANSGSVGSTFYHPYSFVASDHVTHLKNSNFNKYVYLFLATMTQRLTEKYNFNREINDTRLKRETIILPVDEEDNPDYEYMEQYMINLEYKLLKKYLDLKL